MIAEVVATACAGIFAGASIYITLVEHPARLGSGPGLAVREFRPSYQRGAVMQASLAAVGCLSGIAAWLSGAGVAWLIGALARGSVIPFTLAVILPTNKRLLDPALDPESTMALQLLLRWGRLHMVRSLAGALGFLLLVIALARR